MSVEAKTIPVTETIKDHYEDPLQITLDQEYAWIEYEMANMGVLTPTEEVAADEVAKSNEIA